MRNNGIILCFLLALALLAACSGGSDEKGVIESKTKEIGQEAVRMIKAPVENAQAVADKEAERARQMDQRNTEQ